TKGHKGSSQRTQSIVKQDIIFVFLCVSFVFLVVKNTFETASSGLQTLKKQGCPKRGSLISKI
ncbi:MAG: hypothetical protein FWF09_06535, partial [Bacteroidales bacterium]|nr:hypothetical protein [Bacteroidales bacterium]